MPISRNNRTTNSTQSLSSRYTQGGITDIYSNRLGWWERLVFPRSDDDIQLTITKTYEGRPDLIAYDIYKKANLQWFVLQYNNIVDINTELVVGVKIILPTPDRLEQIAMSRSAGGNRVN